MKCWVLAAMAATSWASAAAAEDQHMVERLPMAFVLGANMPGPNRQMQEYVPHGQTVRAWTDMITLQVFQGLHPATPALYLESIAGGWMGACPETPRPVIHSGVAQGYPVAMILLTCPMLQATGQPEAVLIRAIEGSSAMFVAQYAVRAPFDTNAQTKAYTFLKTVQVDPPAVVPAPAAPSAGQ